MVELARHAGDGPLLMRAITERQGIPRKYLHAILTALRSRGLVRSLRGSRGGYALGRPPEEITALDIIRALEGDIVLVDCAEHGELCGRNRTCATRALWLELSRTIERQLAGVTLAELGRRGRPDGKPGRRAAPRKASPRGKEKAHGADLPRP